MPTERHHPSETIPASTIASVGIHITALLLLLVVSSNVQRLPEKVIREVTPLFSPFVPKPIARLSRGGGGGAHALTLATAGRLPVAAKQFVPPQLEILNPAPKLSLPMSIEAPPEVSALPNLGNPLSKLAGLSGGIGGPLGIGDGAGPGVGNKRGGSAGDGDGLTGKVYRAGSGVTLPIVIYKVDPEFSEEARRAHFMGSVLIWAEVDATGHPRNLRVARSAGMGLDEKALESVAKWRFKPGTKDGKPVAVAAAIEVSFHLL